MDVGGQRERCGKRGVLERGKDRMEGQGLGIGGLGLGRRSRQSRDRAGLPSGRRKRLRRAEKIRLAVQASCLLSTWAADDVHTVL